jgi:lipoprotein-anchoring transpeptidase ErfK/SrfK
MNIEANYPFDKKKKNTKNLIALIILIFGLGGILWSCFLYPEIFDSSAFLEKGKAISLSDPLLVRFSGSMIPQTFEGKMSIHPQAELKFRWQNYNRELVVVPVSGWKPETEYKISIEGVRNILFVKRTFNFSFKTAGYPQIENFFPENGSQNVVLDIEDPIAVTFKESIKDFKIKITVDPLVELESQIDLENNKVALIPRKELEKGKKYSLAVYIKGIGEGDSTYKNVLNSFFVTKSNAPQVWEKDFTLRLQQAKNTTEAQIKEGKYIDINLKNQVMVLFENGQALDSYLISSGKRGMDTKQGTFHIANKFPRAWSKAYGLFMPYWMALVPSGQFGIHELPEWPSGYKEGAAHLGIPVSHGCVRLGVGPAERVYNWTEVGTPVVVHS